MLETLAEDHIRTFRAYGVARAAIVGRHALRGALAPIIALTALRLRHDVRRRGAHRDAVRPARLGQELVHAVNVVDLPVVVGLVLVTGFFVVLANAVADVLYAVADRRVVLA